MGFKVHDVFGEGSGIKKRECNCEICLRHDKEHGFINGLKVARLAAKFRSAGICVPTDDSTDVCRDGGKLIFFEINSVNPEKVRNYILRQDKLPSSRKNLVLNLLKRLEQV